MVAAVKGDYRHHHHVFSSTIFFVSGVGLIMKLHATTTMKQSTRACCPHQAIRSKSQLFSSLPHSTRSTHHPIHHHLLRRRQPPLRTTILASSPSSVPPPSFTPTPTPTPTTCILWFKHDLRIDDHPGIHQALAFKSNTAHTNTKIIPFFCFDPGCYEPLAHAPPSATALHRAITSLKTSLQTQLGSDLIVTCGSFEQELLRVVACAVEKNTNDGNNGEQRRVVVVTEEEVERGWKEGYDRTVKHVQSIDPNVTFTTWSAPVFEESPANSFTEWRQQRSPTPLPPLPPPPPNSLLDTTITSSIDIDIQQQHPTPEAMMEMVDRYRDQTTDNALLALEAALLKRSPSPAPSPSPAALSSIQLRSFSVDTDTDDSGSTTAAGTAAAAAAAINRLDGNPTTADVIAEVENAIAGGGADWGEELAVEVAAGEGPVMAALDAYLRYLETAGDGGGSAWQWKLGAAISKYDVPGMASDGCFPVLFSKALAMGVVSRRRVYQQAMAMLDNTADGSTGSVGVVEKVMNVFSGYEAREKKLKRKAKAAAAAAEAGDFHFQMARRREGVVVHGGAVLRHWRWRGILTDYLVASPGAIKGNGESEGDDTNNDNNNKTNNTPAILLVHGFGAFSEHWRDNVAALADQGYTVYAPTFPGYGRAEKPSVPYGQRLWRDFLADFTLRVVRRPVIVAGNSIGGFISASLASDFPGLVQGLVLVNSAGPIVPGYTPPPLPPTPPSPPLFLVDAVSRALFAFLQGDVTNQLRRVYPVQPDRADAWLGGEISRASSDPGALGVFRSVFYLPKPRALNYLVSERFGGPTLILQGAKDPLNDAVGRARQLAALCPNAKVVMLDAGHCPHDEVPEEWNREMIRFVNDVVGSGGASVEVKTEGLVYE